jgi:hypothetical protein
MPCQCSTAATVTDVDATSSGCGCATESVHACGCGDTPTAADRPQSLERVVMELDKRLRKLEASR